MANKKPKVLYLDIENSRMIVKFPTYVLWDIKRIDPKYIEHDWYITCAAWAWLDNEKQKIGKVHTVAVNDFKSYKKNFRNDREVVATLLEVMSQADLIVGHNSDNFDIKKINDRARYWGMEPIDLPPTVDTLKANKKYFKSSSNSLAYLAKKLGVPMKINLPSNIMWAADEGCEKSLKKLMAYNKGDIIAGASVYFRSLPYIKNHPDIRRIMNIIKTPAEGRRSNSCQSCGSTDVFKNGSVTRKDGKYQKIVCRKCGTTTRGVKIA